jgi:hypothetical protein
VFLLLVEMSRSRSSGTVWVEPVSASDCRLVDPLAGDSLGEQIGTGLVAFRGDVGVIDLAASGHRCVYTSTVNWPVDEEEREIDDASLACMAGLCVSELDMSGDVFGGEGDGSGRSGDGDRSVAVDPVDGPVVSVPDHQALAGSECPVVGSGHYLVAFIEDLVSCL